MNKQKKASLLISIFCIGILFGFIAFVTSSVLAQKSKSNCVVTAVGNPGEEEPELPSGCQGSGDIDKAAQDLKDAFGVCGKPASGQTYPDQEECLASELQGKGYASDKIEAMKATYPGSWQFLGCTACEGFVSLVLSLTFGTTDALIDRYWTPNDMLGLDSIQAGSYTFPKVTDPQPGDIGVSSEFGGHVLIVGSVQGSSFIAIESNWTPCTATDDIEHPVETYEYYRPQ